MVYLERRAKTTANGETIMALKCGIVLIHMTKPEQLPNPAEEIPNVGIAEADLTDDICSDIVAIYRQVAYGRERVPTVFMPNYFQMDVARMLKHAHTGFRLGSQYSIHSKLVPVWRNDPASNRYLLKFEFRVNEDIPEGAHELRRRVDETRHEFDRQVAQYLLESGHGVTIEAA